MPRATHKKWEQEDWRVDIIAAAGEFVGTFLFLLFGLGGIQAARTASQAQGVAGAGGQAASGGEQSVTVPDPSFLLMAATSMAMALIFSIWIFFRATGAAFNPQVALTLVLLGAISPIRFAFYFVAQLLGAIAAGGVLQGLLPGPLNVNCSLGSGTGLAQGLFLEMFLTFGFVMTIVMVAVDKNKSTPLAPLAIGFALFSTQLAGINFTGASVNSARALASAVASRQFVSEHWIYWVGPSLGAVLAAALHKGMPAVHYWELNPGADATSDAEAEKATRAAAATTVV